MTEPANRWRDTWFDRQAVAIRDAGYVCGRRDGFYVGLVVGALVASAAATIILLL